MIGRRAQWTAPRIENAVYRAREWTAPRIEDAADAVTTTVAPKVSETLRSTALQVRPTAPQKTGVWRLLDWRMLVGLVGAGAALAGASAGAAIAMRRRYASATEEARNATESTDKDRAAQDQGTAVHRLASS
jgi:hypothetical protein